jgi:hypothetical protein
MRDARKVRKIFGELTDVRNMCELFDCNKRPVA